MRLKSLDIAVLILCAAVIAVTAALVYSGSRAEPQVSISGKGGEWVYPLKTDRRVEVQGPLGITVVQIRDGSVRIVDSPCPNKTCIAAGAISRPNQWIACLPNAVFVRVTGAAGRSEIDAGAY
jgi:hypothetical protein